MLERLFVRNGEFLSALSPARSQYSPTIRCGHSLAESVLVFSLSFRRLEGALHDLLFWSKNRAAKMIRIFRIYKPPGFFPFPDPSQTGLSDRCSFESVNPFDLHGDEVP